MKGTLTYRANVSGFEPVVFSEFTIQSEDPAIKRFAVAAEDNHPPRIVVTVDFEDVPSEEAAMVIAAPEVRRILDRIAFHFNLSVAASGLPQTQFIKAAEDGASTVVGKTSHSTDCFISGTQPRPLEKSAQESLQDFLERPPSPADAKYAEFRDALKSDDIVERYMFLYALLLREKGPSQPKLDTFVRSVGPNVPLRLSTNPRAPSGTMETIYTKLRNEIGHVCPGRTLEDTRREMEQHLANLMELVRKSMS